MVDFVLMVGWLGVVQVKRLRGKVKYRQNKCANLVAMRVPAASNPVQSDLAAREEAMLTEQPIGQSAENVSQ